MYCALQNGMWRRVVVIGGVAVLFASHSVSCTGDGSQERRPLCECGIPPVCGEDCKATCGCSVGQSSCAPEGIMRSDFDRNCYQLIPCSAPNRCVEVAQGPTCAESAAAWGAVRSAYDVRLQWSRPLMLRSGSGALAAGSYPHVQCPEACKVSQGHCAQGLDSCWFVSSGPDAELDRLAALYASLGCPPITSCSCPPAPEASYQIDSSGAAGAFGGPLTCMIH